MKFQWQNGIRAGTLAFALFGGAGILSTPAQAQYPNDRYPQDRRDRNWDQYGNYGGSIELRQTALNAGYNEGVREGSYVGQNRGRSNYEDSNVYRKATKDYSSRLGDRELYRRYFREAFATGYGSNNYDQSNNGRDDRYRNRDSNQSNNQGRRGRNWDGYGNFGGSPQLRQTALNAGYDEGNKQGRSDRNKRYGTGFQGQGTYQKATKDYSSGLGDRELYRRYFRAAYENGYSDGVNGY